MVTSHASAFDEMGRPLAPSAGFGPHPAITRTAEGWMIRHAARKIPDDHFRVQVQERPVTEQAVLDCADCGRGVFILSPDTERPGYLVNVAQILAAVTSHLHTHHERYLDGRDRAGDRNGHRAEPESDDGARAGGHNGSGAGTAD